MAHLGELLAELRHDHGMKQDDLAAIIHVSTSTISSYERGQQFPPIDKLESLADVFHVTTDYLLGRSSVSMPLDILETEILPGRTASCVIRDINGLSPERKQALKLILDDMKKISQILGKV
jgi:transcriptional regulator with XRE-family HTH domain